MVSGCAEEARVYDSLRQLGSSSSPAWSRLSLVQDPVSSKGLAQVVRLLELGGLEVGGRGQGLG